MKLMNNKQLISYHQEIQGMKGSILYQFHASKIKEFYNKNLIRINTTLEKLHALNQKYFQYDGDKLKMGEDKKPLIQPDFKMDDFDRELNEIMEQEINIVI